MNLNSKIKLFDRDMKSRVLDQVSFFNNILCHNFKLCLHCLDLCYIHNILFMGHANQYFRDNG